MSSADDTPLRLAIDIADEDLAARLADLLAGVDGLQIVAAGAAADVHLAAPAEIVQDHSAGPSLTPRELEVLALLAEGASNKLIARRLSISTHTAKFHVGRVLDKLDAISRTDAVAHAARLGVIDL